MVDVPLLRIDADLEAPRRMRAGDAAADLPAAEATTIEPGGRALVPTGFAIAVPVGFAAFVLPRSGLSWNQGVTVLNAPGLIDSGYRGEIKVVLHNTSAVAVEIERGQRIAQVLVMPVPAFQLVEVAELPDAPDDRGAAGFGSSGA